jgi:AcrR family transcriptional regulator
MSHTTAPYHHGALRQALIEATEALLAEKGAEGFSLREVARRAGVSPAAPAHHFGDAAGLLTAVATLGFEGLTRALQAGDARGAGDPRAALREQGVEYVRFALRHPGRFRLMFRSGKLHDDAELERHARAAFLVLAHGVGRACGVGAAWPLPAEPLHAVTALWSLVHGYAHLAIAGKLALLGGADDLEAFVGRSLGPILDAALAGLLPAGRAEDARRAARPAALGRAARSPTRRRT